MILKYQVTCNSSYHTELNLPTIQVMVDGNTTLKQVIELLLEGDTFSPIECQYFMAESYYAAYEAAVKEWAGSSAEDIWCESLDVPRTQDEADSWDCYAYFVIEEINEHMVELLRKYPNKCLYCGSTDLLTQIQDGNIDIEVRCQSCAEGWVEHYELSGATFNEY